MKRLVLTTVLCCLCVAMATAKQRKDGYILRLDAKTQIARLDLETAVAVGESLRPPVLWVQRGGRRYEIRDGVTLDRAKEAMRPVLKINDEYDAFRRRARPVYDEEEDLDREIDAFEEDDHKADETRLAELRERRRALRPRLNAVEAEERELDARQQRAEVASERILDQIIDEAIRKGLARRTE